MASPSAWTPLEAGIKSPAPVDDEREALIRRVRAEYREMPGLCLTVRQACRLWQIDATNCTRILDVLVAEGFLRRTATGAFIGLALKGVKP